MIDTMLINASTHLLGWLSIVCLKNIFENFYRITRTNKGWRMGKKLLIVPHTF